MNFKPLRKRLNEASQQNKLRLDIIQQDYLLSWVLYGIYHQPKLKSSLIFKGGTALKKSYFGNYRFSEDLDFSATNDAPFGSLLMEEILEACKYAENRIYEYAPVKIFVKRYEEKCPHPEGQEAFKISAQFPWQSQPLTTVMIEISRKETIIFNPLLKPILHEYGEIIEQNILVYSLEEIVLEKLRAILQHIKKLHECDWTRSRARDYYDLWRIFTSFEDKLVLKDFTRLLQKKCTSKNVIFNGLESFFDLAMVEYVSKTWEDWLGPLVPNLPDCDQVIEELKMKLEFLFINFEEKLTLILQRMIQGELKGESLYIILEKAVKKEKDINIQNINGHKFLQLLIQKAKLDSRKKLGLIKISIDCGINIDVADASGLTPFQVAVRNKEKAIADFLLSKGARNKVPMSMHTNYYQMYLRFPEE